MAKSKKKAPKGPDYTSWIIRGVVVVALVVVGMMALPEFKARQNAQASLAAVSEKLQASSDESPLRKSQIKPLIAGAPAVESTDHKALNSPTVAAAERYTWAGSFRNYTLTIGYSLGDDPEVEIVEGPK